MPTRHIAYPVRGYIDLCAHPFLPGISHKGMYGSPTLRSLVVPLVSPDETVAIQDIHARATSFGQQYPPGQHSTPFRRLGGNQFPQEPEDCTCILHSLPIYPLGASNADINGLKREAGVRIFGLCNMQTFDRGAQEYLEAVAAAGSCCIDLSGATESVALAALAYVQAMQLGDHIGVVLSNTASQALAEHPHNISDRVLEQIASVDGLVGVTTNTSQLGRDHIEQFAAHVAHIESVCGGQRVAVGSNGVYTKLTGTHLTTLCQGNGASRCDWLEFHLNGLGWASDRVLNLLGGNALRFLASRL